MSGGAGATVTRATGEDAFVVRADAAGAAAGLPDPATGR